MDKLTSREFQHLCGHLEYAMRAPAFQTLYKYGFYHVEGKADHARSLEDIQWIVQARAEELHGLGFPVSPDGNDTAIYSSEGNKVFRAWHDLLHYQLNVGFDYTGERKVARAHLAYTVVPEQLQEIMWADTAGQVEFYKRTDGKFVEDQRTFVLHCVNEGFDTAINLAREKQGV